MNKKILLTIFALAFFASVFCLCACYGACDVDGRVHVVDGDGGFVEVCGSDDYGVVSCGNLLACPWDVDVEVRYGNDVCSYKLSDNLYDGCPECVYYGGIAKAEFVSNAKEMQLPFEAVCQYVLPRFSDVVGHFAYVECDRRDAVVEFDGQFSYTEGNDGISIDKYGLLMNVVACAGKTTEVRLPVLTDKAVTVQELKSNTALKGKFTTNYSSSGANRCFNIQKCAKSLNGTIVEAGAKFSFNEVVGPRTEACGYKNAVVISNGNYVEGVGGGVCQVSTTLYNALLLANFVPSAHRHSLVSGYVAAGFDAMVSYGSTDLTFTNDTDMPLYIAARAQNKQITFSVYGVPNKYRVERQSDVVREPYSTVYVTDNGLAEGEQKTITHGSDGVKSKSYLLYYEGDKLANKLLLRTDVYKKVDRVVAVPPDKTSTNIPKENAG